MDLGEAYQYIYIIFVTIVSLYVFNKYGTFSRDRLWNDSTEDNHQLTLLLTLLMIVFFTFRPQSPHFGDSQGYINHLVVYHGQHFSFDWGAENYLFDNLYAWLGCNGFHYRVLFLIMSSIYFGGLYFCSKEFFPKDSVAAFVIYLAGFSTFSYGVNGLKAGTAAVLFLMALVYKERKQWIPVILLLFLSLGIHHSMVMPICAFIMCNFVKNPKVYMWIWIVALVIAALDITLFQTFFANFVDDKSASYLLSDGGTIKISVFGGFRVDFILYSCVPLVLGWYLLFSKRIEVSENYLFILNYYAITNALWLLAMYAEYNNRIAYLSWFAYPFVLIYPYLREDTLNEGQYGVFKIVAWGHLIFTIFMTFIYY